MEGNKITFGKGQVVVLRNGKVGVVATFNEQPFLLVFDSFTTQIGKYDENFKHKNTQYDIVKILDGSEVEEVKNVFKKSFKTEELTTIWEEKQ